ncbi:hypothetical protein NEMBOFW57_005044 [Staphylotrichum longicolle]|uniref:Endonuclease III homolog n=1 Tax=Staphylotrichum longicolle TaxID=669026 RepID=A0AAD4EW29_9PEZI|nr:hypothetical protein NEMBOFW57_005044 [Staphylotrichum longicolle]
MRTSRVAKETSKYFDTTSTTTLPRRSTRASTALARFAYNGADNASSPDVTLGSDIEDAVKTTVARKRKRAETVTQSAPRRGATRGVKADVKTEIKTEVKSEIKSEHDSDGETKPQPRGRVRKPARKITDPATGAVTVEPPSDWEEMYNLVKEMRLTGPAANAAVDTMGCSKLARPDASARDRRFQTLVSLMLSSQTKDTVNAEAMRRLHTELPPYKPGAPPGLNLDNMLAVDPALLNELIGKVGFHNNKTKYLKQTALLLRSHFASDIPPTIAGLTSLPGVGPKMAHLCMSSSNGWDRVEGIGVDVHVHRITNQIWGWHHPPTKTPEETRLALESWLPRDRWKEINWLLVGFGQTVCLPVGRKCGECEVGLQGLCRSAERAKVAEGRRRRVVKKEEEVSVVVKGEGEGQGLGLVKGEEGLIKEEEGVGKGEGEVVLEVKKEEEEMEVDERIEREAVVNAPVSSPTVKVKVEDEEE